MKDYIVKKLVVGEQFGTNCYILKPKTEARVGAVVIDPGDDPSLIKSALFDMNAYPALVLLTHGHFDHILAVDDIRTVRTKVAIHQKDAHSLTERDTFSSLIEYDPRPLSPADEFFTKDGIVELQGFKFTVIQTPGHTEGSVCYVFEDVMFTGDTLFKKSIGRTDFFGGSSVDMAHSLKKLRDYPGDFLVCPGHGDITRLSYERNENVYIKNLRP